MPCQVSWQFVAIKLQPSVHGLGAEAVVAAVAPVGATSAAQASTPQEAPPAAMITAAKNAELCTASLLAQQCTIVSRYEVGRQESTDAISVTGENSDPSGSRATVISSGQRVPRNDIAAPTWSPSPGRVRKKARATAGLFLLRGSLSCSRWYRARSHRTGSRRFRSVWSDRLDCRSDFHSSDARRLTARSWRATRDELVGQMRPCSRARTQRPMLLPQVS